MNPTLTSLLENLEFGDVQQHKNLAVYPVFTMVKGGPSYVTLKQALDSNAIRISEKDEGGSVPELKAENLGNAAVLILDGEELVGAKQNRILNTTILIRAKTMVTIPVSCVEQGRWARVSDNFRESEAVAPAQLRRAKMASVSRNLEVRCSYAADQGQVWAEVHDYAERAQVNSRTSAMRDVFDNRKAGIDIYMTKFKCIDGQRGFVVMIGRQVVGLEILSRAPAFEKIFQKLIRSYAMDALLEPSRKSRKPSVSAVHDFINEARSSSEQKFRSVGAGWDHRFEGSCVVGSTLIYRKTAIHAAFFRKPVETDDGRGLASYSKRAGYRGTPPAR